MRSGLLWAALTETGAKVIRTVASVIAGAARRAFQPLAKIGGWLLRLTGRPGARVVDKFEQIVDKVTTRVRQIVSDIRETISPYLRRDGLLLQGLRNVLGARALGGLVKSVLPMPWNLLVRVVANLAAVPAGVRRSAWDFLRGLLGQGPQDDTTPPPAAASVVTDLETERAQRQDRDIADLDEAVPNLQRYPAKKATHKRR